ncbi:MAG: hypothetical protein NC548_45400 [Lachnospiraceae bacterium]|nr:hypothetical protein [Lachnospiraceae bacterium]
MRKKLLSLFLFFSMLIYAVPVFAAPAQLPITKSNKWEMSANNGTAEYTLPYTAYYDIVLSGTQGNSLNGTSGGNAYTLKKTIKLEKGTTIRYSVANQGTAYMNGTTAVIPGGSAGKLWINGTLVMLAAGGEGLLTTSKSANVKGSVGTNVASAQIWSGEGTSTSSAYNCSIHWHAYPSWVNTEFPNEQETMNWFIDSTYPNCPSQFEIPAGTYLGPGFNGPRYSSGKYNFLTGIIPSVRDMRLYDTVCYKFTSGKTRVMCDDAYYPPEWHVENVGEHDGVQPNWTVLQATGGPDYSCGSVGYLDLTYTKQCGKNHGQVEGTQPDAGSCTWTSDWTPDSQSKDHTGAGYFYIGLHERPIYMYDSAAPNDYWLDQQAYLIMYEDQVVGFKRP